MKQIKIFASVIITNFISTEVRLPNAEDSQSTNSFITFLKKIFKIVLYA